MYINAYARSLVYLKLNKIKSYISISETNFAKTKYILKAAQERTPYTQGNKNKNKTYG